MKSNTNVFVGLRNIGDSQDPGQVFQGSLKESILWLAERLGSMTMQRRFVIGIGRDEAGARAALELQRGNNRLATMELGDELDRLLAGDSIEDVLEDVAGPTVPDSSRNESPLDTWKGIAS